MNQLKIISDNITNRENIAFGFDAYAGALAELIATNTNKTPFTIGISGKWGSGKTTLMNTIEKLLDTGFSDTKKFRKVKTVWFQAWKYKEDDQILAALVQEVIWAIKKDESFMKKKGKTFFEKINTLLKRIDWLKLVAEAGRVSIGLNADRFLTLEEGEQMDFDPGKGIGDKTAKDEKKYKEFLSFYDIFDKHFDELLWTYLGADKEQDGDKEAALVIFIDDLDRCPLPKIIQILETIKLFMDRDGCIFVIGAAKDIIQEALKREEKYKDIGAEQFLEKIIQIEFSLPKKTLENAAGFIKEIKSQLGIGKELSDDAINIILPILDFNPRRIIALFNRISLQQGIMRYNDNNIDFKKILFWRVLEIYSSSFFNSVLKERKYFNIFKTDLEIYNQLSPEDKKKEDELKEQLTDSDNIIWLKDESIISLMEKLDLAAGDYEQLVSHSITFEEEIPSFDKVEEIQKYAEEMEEKYRNDPRDLKEFIAVEGGIYDLEGLGEQKIKPFKISKYPVTNTWYKEFLDAGGYGDTKYWSTEGAKWLEKEKPEYPEYWNDQKWNHPSKPVVGVSWYEAEAFCKWLSANLKGTYRLLTEEEWQAAAGGKEGRTYPWGNEWDKSFCNNREVGLGKTSIVGIFRKGETPEAITDMAGNVWEWTTGVKGSRRVIRGGSWYNGAGSCRVADRFNSDAADRINSLGFRLALSL